MGQVQTKQVISNLGYAASSTAKWVLQYLKKSRSAQSSTWSKLPARQRGGRPWQLSQITDIPGLLPPEWRTKVHVWAPQVGRFAHYYKSLFFQYIVDSNHTFFHVDLCLVYSLLYSLQQSAYVPAIIALIIQSHLVGDPLWQSEDLSVCGSPLNRWPDGGEGRTGKKMTTDSPRFTCADEERWDPIA